MLSLVNGEYGDPAYRPELIGETVDVASMEVGYPNDVDALLHPLNTVLSFHCVQTITSLHLSPAGHTIVGEFTK